MYRVSLEVYGWYGSQYNAARSNNGELRNTIEPDIEYIFYTSLTSSIAAAIDDSSIQFFNFEVTIDETTMAPTEEGLDPIILIAIGCGVVLAGLCIIFIIVIVCVVGRRRNDQPRRNNRYTHTHSECMYT